MSRENIKNFFLEMEKNQELREKFTSSVADEIFRFAIISFAESNGFCFSSDEFQE